jgi:cytochrome P450
MARIPAASLLENLQFNVAHVLPYYLQGIFSRRRFWVWVWTSFHPDPLGVNFFRALRQKYGDYVYLRLLRSNSLFLLAHEAIEHVLNHSADYPADSELKRRGMSHFQPGALTISRGAEWQDRRRFNEAVLDSAAPVHRHADVFLQVIADQTRACLRREPTTLVWSDFELLFRRITLQIIFGLVGSRDDAVADRLRSMMQESNRVFLLGRSRHFDPFYRSVRAYLQTAEAESLAGQTRLAPSTDRTRVENQVPHWMFATMETLAINTTRAFALIVSSPSTESRVRREIQQQGSLTVPGIAALDYLEGCIQEAMRLWPSTPMLVRETTGAQTLRGRQIPDKTPVVIFNNFIHRDWESIPFADNFTPEHWLGRTSDYRFNHLSNGGQVCAGKNLALFVAKAVIANLLLNGRYRLRSPALQPARRLPQVFNEFRVRFDYLPPFHGS